MEDENTIVDFSKTGLNVYNFTWKLKNYSRYKSLNEKEFTIGKTNELVVFDYNYSVHTRATIN